MTTSDEEANGIVAILRTMGNTKICQQAADALNSLLEERKELRKALEPFAEFSAKCGNLFHFVRFDDGTGCEDEEITVDEVDFRRAQSALSPQKKD